MKEIVVGIPAYKARDTIEQCISSIDIQTLRDHITVIIANDNPGDSYSYLAKKFNKLDFVFLDEVKSNGGPGIARNRIIEAITDSKWVTFIDADDVFYTPYAIEKMIEGTKTPNTIQVQSVFVQPVRTNEGIKFLPRTDLGHPWVFGRLTYVPFIKQNDINFGTIRQMEDGRFQHCIRLLIEGTQFKITQIPEITYVWKEGSEHSITRSGVDINDGIPVYNYGMCQIGASIAFKQAIDFASKKNPFNGSIARFAAEQMVNHYFTYYECVQNCPKFAEQNWWLAKWFYHNCYKPYCTNLNYDILERMYMQFLSARGSQFKQFPELTFRQWWDKIQTEPFKLEDLPDIHNKLPKNIIEVERKTGQLPENILELFKDDSK